jgi:hypothetical protein
MHCALARETLARRTYFDILKKSPFVRASLIIMNAKIGAAARPVEGYGVVEAKTDGTNNRD